MKQNTFIMVLSILLAVYGNSNGQTIPDYVPTNGLVGWWPFNQNANDEGDYGNDGVINGATLVSDRYGNLDAAYYFNGTSDFIRIADSPSLGVDSFTIAVWVKLDISNAPGGYIITKGCEEPAGANVSYRVSFGTDSYTVDNWTPWRSYIEGPNTSLNENWTHVLYSYDGSSNKLYIDGQRVSSAFQSGNTTASLGSLMFGAREIWSTCTVSSHFSGKLDDIAIWNRALNQSEIKRLYDSDIGLGVPSQSYEERLMVYPNPTQTDLYIKSEATFNVSIVDLKGRVVVEGQVSENKGLDVSFLKPGMYFLYNSDNSMRIKFAKQ